MPRANECCPDLINLALRRRSFGKFDPYAPAFKGRLDSETISHPINVPLPYSLVQLKIEATEQACHRNIELRMPESRNLRFVSEGWMCECGYETVVSRMTYLIPIQTRVPRPYGINTRSIRARPRLFESHRSGKNFDGSGKYEGSRRMSRGVMLTGV